MDHSISLHYDFHDIAAARAANAHTPAIGEIADTLPIEGKLVDAMGTSEECNTHGAGGIHGKSGQEERGSFSVAELCHCTLLFCYARPCISHARVSARHQA